MVQQTWNETVADPPNLRIAEKLRRLKKNLKSWNWNTFDDLKVRIENSQRKIRGLEDQIQIQWKDLAEGELVTCKTELKQLLCWEVELLYQKTRAKWLQDGDRNTSFFHVVTQERRRRNSIALSGRDGDIVSHPQDVCNMAMPYFAQLFTATLYIMHDGLFDQYPSHVK